MSETNQPTPKPLTPEEMEARKKEMMTYWKSQEEFLDAQLAHQRRVTELDELRTDSAIAQIRLAQIMNPEPEKPSEMVTGTGRSLKKEPSK
jgi:hypothetical protein